MNSKWNITALGHGQEQSKMGVVCILILTLASLLHGIAVGKV
jgi:hypothetical protein